MVPTCEKMISVYLPHLEKNVYHFKVWGDYLRATVKLRWGTYFL
jgi:hypothetical protein